MSVIDMYKRLFGRKGIQDGDVISLSEHGRSGGVSTGQPFKFIDNINYQIKLIEDSGYTYIGYANPGTAESAESWKVARLDTSTGLNMVWAGNSTDFKWAVTNMPSLFA